MSNLHLDFLSPADEYTPIPFWFWNDELSCDTLKKQLYSFYLKGIRAVILHPRMGLPDSLVYLSDEFLDYVEYVVKLADEWHMKVILYDEAMYPSGSANGLVVKSNPAFAAKGLSRTKYTLGDCPKIYQRFVVAIAVNQTENLRLPLSTQKQIDEFTATHTNDWNIYYFTLEDSHGTIRGVHYGEDDGDPNAPKAADLLNPEAMQSFIHITYDRYYERLYSYFGSTIIGMFTDEPSIMGRNFTPGLLGWTNDFLSNYLQHGGAITDLMDLFEEETLTNQTIHKIYRHAVHDQLSASYYQPISQWCKAHKIALTGHPLKSDDIGYLKYFDIPCQDIVWRYIDPELQTGLTGPHSTMGKCSSDSARHHNKRRNGNECFGACGKPKDPWDFTFEDMKWYLDWLFVRGVNTIVPHAFFYSLRDPFP